MTINGIVNVQAYMTFIPIIQATTWCTRWLAVVMMGLTAIARSNQIRPSSLRRSRLATTIGAKKTKGTPDRAAVGTFHAAEASDSWRAKVSEALGERLIKAAATGEVRSDLSSETLARWVTRINFSLISEQGNPEDGGDEGILRALLIPSLAATGGGSDRPGLS